jgi:hypothetical protein
MTGKAALSLRIEALGRSHDFSLEADKPFVIGRAADADFRLDADSISQKHVELLWDGALLRVRDLDSSNGSFRMPQDSPFLEAHFGPKDRELSLRLAKIPVSVSWKSDDPSQQDRTEIIDSPLPPPRSQEPPAIVEAAPKKEKRQARPKAEVGEKGEARAREEISWIKPIFLSSVFVCAIQNFYFFSQHARYLAQPKSTWVLGPAIDLYMFWLSDASIFLGIGLMGVLLAILLKKRLPPLPSSPREKLLVPLAFVLTASVLVWPVLFLKESGNADATRAAVSEFRAIEQVLLTHDFAQSEKNLQISSKLTDLSGPLKGSSLFYAFWHNFQKKRVVRECGGIGEENWEKKRGCLVLLFALSLDGYTSIRPVYLGPTASSLVFLSSLDGVIRVLAAEGPGSESVKLFVSSLPEAGLKKEADDFVALVESFRGQSFDDLMRALLEQRLGVERKVFAEQSRAGLPEDFRLNLMGPLEMGI